MASQPTTIDDRSNCPVSAHERIRLSRSKVAYWRTRVQKVVGRSATESDDYSARIVYRNRRVRFRLSTPNKDAAAAKAAQIFTFLVENGWEATIAKFKPDAGSSPALETESATVGALIEASQKYSTARPQSLSCYALAMRKIVAEIEEIPKNGGGWDAWRTKVDSVPLRKITPARVQSWRQSRLARAGKDASAQRRAAVTANSSIRSAKALFSRKLLPFIAQELELPSPLPFTDVRAEKVSSLRYQSKIDAQDLLAQANDELKGAHPEPYKIFLLALVCGLRVGEIDHLLWRAFDFEASILRIETTEYHQLKSEDSAGDVDLSEEFIRLFQAFAESASGDFVVEPHAKDRTSSARPYRCHSHLQFLRVWLREHGVKAQKPIHTLRKEVGAQIASDEGIYAASRYLRHADIQTTAAFYADKKTKVVPRFNLTPTA